MNFCLKIFECLFLFGKSFFILHLSINHKHLVFLLFLLSKSGGWNAKPNAKYFYTCSIAFLLVVEL